MAYYDIKQFELFLVNKADMGCKKCVVRKLGHELKKFEDHSFSVTQVTLLQ